LDDFSGIGGETFGDLGYEGLQGTAAVPFKTPKGGTLTTTRRSTTGSTTPCGPSVNTRTRS
jgi:hypothetical protein